MKALGSERPDVYEKGSCPYFCVSEESQTRVCLVDIMQVGCK